MTATPDPRIEMWRRMEVEHREKDRGLALAVKALRLMQQHAITATEARRMTRRWGMTD